MEASFNVTSGDEQPFRSFINELRETLRERDRPFVMEEAARLPPQVDNPELMHLTLRAYDDEVVLAMRTDNLFVIGFRNAAGQWYELQHDNGRAAMINGSIALDFNGSYQRGLRPLDESQYIGPTIVAEAINGLAGYNGGGTSDVRRWLRTLIVNFVESIRLNTIADRVDILMRNPDIGDQQLSTENVQLINDWGALSTALIIAADDTEGSSRPFRNFRTIGITTALAAAMELGMVLIKRRHDRRFRRDVEEGIGLTLVEILGVLINNIDSEDPGDLYGTVDITDCFGTVILFNRDKHHTQSVGPGGWADITPPSRGISESDDFRIDVNLMDHDSFPDPSPDDQVAKGVVFWNSRDALSRENDTVQKKEVKGTSDSAVEVHYVVLTDAVVATVEVVLVDGDGEDVPDVYGSIMAETKTQSGETLKYKLFHKRRDEDIGVPKGKAIPLLRNVISAALCSQLRVHADLWDKDSFPDPSPDDQIALGSVDFTPRLAGVDDREIKGANGRVTVRVTWSVSY